ncbi:hypothetical protein [Mesorhizobium sp. M8A.F.Ca.ET.165.01.1.1]|uniref:hypothetical protein n=1 Tax=Mesorhizobium sp. M8A.F.Ca.ET.165.01.1.1 TaxID=2563960 RepID=UPI001093F40A|nr:hypothetical protein [Mesorhizobium sp. M8A.F.Ca.ET.165.01.1.1]TGT35684.1 hypothetical protein EN808_31870 [Mesorhizobium sp. M8A.F.Ca.ET.165.01.1.1]
MTSIQIDVKDGLSSSTAIKGPVKAATTANITLSGEQTIDGVSIVTDDRVLVKNQTTASDNGIYIADTGPWRRSKDFNKTKDVRSGTLVLVTGGTQAGVWQVTTADPISVGTSSIAFSKTVQPYDADLAAIAALPTTTYGRSLLTAASAIVLATSLGVIPDAAVVYGADGGGVNSNVTPFTNAGAAGKLTFIPKPVTKYAFASNLKGYNIGGAWLPDPAMTWNQLTDGGKFNMYRGRFTTNGANIWRFSDRTLFGEAASKFAADVGNPDGGTSWVKNQIDCPWYLPLNAGVLFTSGGDDGTATNNPPYGFVSAVKTSTVGQGAIAFGAVAVADMAVNSAWGYIAELQREAGAGQVYGMEIDAKNKGSNTTLTPNAQVAGTFGIWAGGGGDATFGGASVSPSTAAFVVLKNSNTWNSGMVFMKDALTAGEAIAMSSEGVGGAHRLNWYNAAGNNTFSIIGSATDAINWSLNRSNSGLVVSAGGRISLAVLDAASAVNYLQLTPGATGQGVFLLAQGTDTNISGLLRGKGTGGWKLQDGGAATKFEFNTTGIGFFATAPVAQKTGWGVPTGTLARTTYAAYAGQTHTASYVQATVQALDDACRNVSQRLAALLTDLHGTAGYGLINT